MKKVIFVFLFSILLLGCSKNDQEISNELSIKNNALAAVAVNFKGYSYSLAVGESKTINDISNGSYAYETAATIPPGAKSITLGAHMNDSLEFTGQTKYTLYFAGMLTGTAPDIAYEVSATLSTSNQEKTTTHLLNLF